MKGRVPSLAAVGVIALMACLSTELQAQWTTQSVSLRPGWNAIFLEVQPEPADANAMFAGLPIESVWRWNRRFAPVQYIQDPNLLVVGQPDWLVYVPPTHALHSKRSLYTVDGGHSYLIKLDPGAGPVQWVLKGRPAQRRPEWLSDSFNLVGFPIAATTPPTFASFFSSSVAHRDGPFFRLASDGTWTPIATPQTTLMQPGEAFWVWCTGSSGFAGPIAAAVEQGNALDYGRVLVEQTLRLRNDSPQSRTLRLSVETSEPPPSGAAQDLAGNVALYYWRYNPATRVREWAPLSGVLSLALPAGQQWPLRLELRRAELTPAPAGVADPYYAGLLRVTDGTSALTLGVSAIGLSQPGALAPNAVLRPRNGVVPGPYAGLWIGYATVTEVSQPSASDPDALLSAASDFQFRLLVHVDGTGQARLLQKVLQMWKPGTYQPDPDDPTKFIVDEPGRAVLVTDESLTAGLTGALLRDGVPVARRFSSAAFSFPDPLPMNPVGAFGQQPVSCSIPIGFDDPLNPFKHAFHPDHNNLDERYQTMVAEGEESFSVRRDIELAFSAEDPDGLTLAGWGDTEVGGDYRETITGLHRLPLHVSGTFRLHRASRIPVLNDAPLTSTANLPPR